MEEFAAQQAESEGQQVTIAEQTESTPVILGATMERVNPNTLEAWWRRDREMYGLDDLTFHELRHSYLSTLALKGVHPKVMQDLGGHASFSTTMDIYTHVNMESKRRAAEAVEDLFPAAEEPVASSEPTFPTAPRVIAGGRRKAALSTGEEGQNICHEAPSVLARERFVSDLYQAASV